MKRWIGTLAMAASGMAGAVGGTAGAAPAPLPAAEVERARHAFDFLHGDWTVQNRRQS